MGSERIGCGRHTSPARTERNSRCANSSGGDGSRETQQVPGRHAADPRNPRVRIRSRASAHRCARGEIAQAKEYRRELKSLKEQRQMLRKFPERRIGQVLLAPYCSPEKL